MPSRMTLPPPNFTSLAVTAVLGDQVAFHLDPKIGVGQTHLVARGGTEHLRVSAP